MKLYFREDDYDNYRSPVDRCRKDKDISKCNFYLNAKNSKEKQRIQECFYDASSKSCDLFDLDCAGSSVAYINAMHCQKDLPKYMEGYDYVVFNCGHQTSKSTEYPYWIYRDLVKTFSANLVASDVPKSSRLFYLENAAVPLRQDRQSVAEVDRRTYHRLIIFDAIARHEMQKSGLQFRNIFAFYSTLVLFDKFCDCGYYPWSAQMPQLLALSDALKKSIISKPIGS